MPSHRILRKSLAPIMALSLLASYAHAKESAPEQSEQVIGDRADAILSRMTPQEKAAQLITAFALPGAAAEKQTADSISEGIGSLLFVTDPKVINDLQRKAATTSRQKIPLLIGFDVIHGLHTIFPVPIAQAASWDPTMIEANQTIAARESRAVGIHWAFAPNVDIARDPRWGRMVEGAGEDPYLGSAVAAAQVRGFQGERIGAPSHIIAGPKHFAGYGAGLGGRDYDEVNLSDSELWNVYLPPFKAAVDAGAGNIMSAYMGLNGIPASANHWLLTDVLRRQWGFKGWVVSDANAAYNLTTHGIAANRREAAGKAINAGLDMEMTFLPPAFTKLPEALADGEVTQSRIDEAVRRILITKLRLGLFESPYVDEAKARKVFDDPKSLVAAMHAAERSAVLLKNENALLPLDRARIKSIAVIGALANSPVDTNGPWVFDMNHPVQQSILEGIEKSAGKGIAIKYSTGVKIPPRFNVSPIELNAKPTLRPEPADDDAGIAEAVANARNSDVAVLVIGESFNRSGETASTSTLDLPGRQQALLDAVVATGKPVIVLLMNGRPLDLKDTKAQAILDLWFPGSRGGDAAANLLFGDAVPGGKLPFTWPRNAGQVPLIYSHLRSHEPNNSDKRYANESNAPVYPFGYGLSYSTFEYSNVTVDQPEIRAGDTVTVSFDLRNTGARTADEVAQLYIHQIGSSAARPVRELKGFRRVSLKAGETRKIQFQLGSAELRYWNAASKDWVIDAKSFEIAVGGSSTAKFSSYFNVLP